VLIFLLLLVRTYRCLCRQLSARGDRRENWQAADRSSAGLLPKPADHSDALVRVFAARTVRWRGIFAVHTWIVVKERGASRYSRYDYMAWGEPIRIDEFVPDGRWFGAVRGTVVSVDGDKAKQLIPKIRSVVESYKSRGLRRLSSLDGTKLEYLNPGDPGRGSGAECRFATHRYRQGLSLPRRLVWPHAFRKRRVCFTRRLFRSDGWMDRGRRAKLLRWGPWSRCQAASIKASWNRPSRRASHSILISQ
jgi:hypothetical protein